MRVSDAADAAVRQQLLAQAGRLAGVVAETADAIERDGHLPAGLSRAFAEAGFYRMLVPRVYGGLEVHPAVFCEVVERIARADGSAAWCLFISATAATASAFLPEDTARAIFTDPLVCLSGVFAPRGVALPETRDGIDGFRVSGRWAWGSAAHNADFIMGGCLVMDAHGQPERLPGGAPLVRSMLFDAADVRRLDNWQVSGLCGTGSADFEVSDLFVPRSRSCSYLSDTPLAVPLYGFPTFGLLALGIAATCLGMAQGAIDALVALAATKRPDASAKVLAQRPSAQQQVAQAHALVRSARAFVDQSIDAAWTLASTAGAIGATERADLRLAATHAVRASAQAIDLMYGLGGGTSVYRRSILQRYFRDVHVATSHMMVSESTLELVGRVLLGVPTDLSML